MSKRSLSDTEEEPTSQISGNEEDEEEFEESSQEEEEFISHRHPRVQVNPLDAEKIVRQILDKDNWQEKIIFNTIVAKWRKETISQGISESSFLVAMDILNDLLEISTYRKRCCGCCNANPKKIKNWSDREEKTIDENETLFESTEEEPEKKKKKVQEEEKKKAEGNADQKIKKKLDENEEDEDNEDEMNENEDEVIEDDDEIIEDDEEEEEEGYYPRSTKFCLCPCAHCAFDERGVSSYVCLEKENLIPADLTERLKKQLNEIVENTPVDKLDWHPGSNQQVLDIIHPSLYCYSKELSVLNEKKGEVRVGVAETQWIPTDFKVDSDNKVTPLSYINNVNPITQKDLQDTICEVLSHFIEPVNNFVNIKDKVQVIVKAANVIVTPEQGFYPGGTWHTEGDTENIVATGIFYYECQNIKQSFLEFRQSLREENFYYIEQDNVLQAWERFGIHDGDKLCEVIGKVKTTEGKCIIFPNTNQHRVKHFFPEDPKKTATRKILVFFFVDPDAPIISTSHIDNQRRDVIISNSFSLAQKITYPVLVKNVIPFIPQMTEEQANETREILMDHRKYKRDDKNEQYEREFSLCEH